MNKSDQFTPQELALIERLRSAPQPTLSSRSFAGIRQQMLQELDGLTVARPASIPKSLPLSPVAIAIVIIAIVIMVMGGIFFSATQDGGTVVTPTVTTAETPETQEADATEPALEMTAEPSPESQNEPTLESTPVSTPEQISTVPSLMIIEGPVSAINLNTITIFDMEIQVDAADPIWADLQVGDVVRVEGNASFGGGVIIIIAVNITIVDVDVIITDGGGGLPANCSLTSKGGVSCRGRSS